MIWVDLVRRVASEGRRVGPSVFQWGQVQVAVVGQRTAVAWPGGMKLVPTAETWAHVHAPALLKMADALVDQDWAFACDELEQVRLWLSSHQFSAEVSAAIVDELVRLSTDWALITPHYDLDAWEVLNRNVRQRWRRGVGGAQLVVELVADLEEMAESPRRPFPHLGPERRCARALVQAITGGNAPG